MGKRQKAIPVQSNRAMLSLVLFLSIGVLIIVVYAAQAPGLSGFASATGIALAIACASTLVGGLLGFLFGIPRTLQGDERLEASTEDRGEGGDKKAGDKDNASGVSYAPNTNLEQISDWLTKILVGVGLTQIGSVPDMIKKYADFVGPGFGDLPAGGPFSVALLIFFAIDGFLICWLWTRFHLAGALRQADEASWRTSVESWMKDKDVNATAFSMMNRVLYAQLDKDIPDQEKINVAIADASRETKADIFWKAVEIRRGNWDRPENLPLMERTIPLFRALIADNSAYHTNHGQLGYALKDRRKSGWSEEKADLTEAKGELDDAIRLRGDWRESGWPPTYEFVRAICAIRLDNAFRSGKPSDDRTKGRIVSDLCVAVQDRDVKLRVQNESSIIKWSAMNNFALKD